MAEHDTGLPDDGRLGFKTTPDGGLVLRPRGKREVACLSHGLLKPKSGALTRGTCEEGDWATLTLASMRATSDLRFRSPLVVGSMSKCVPADVFLHVLWRAKLEGIQPGQRGGDDYAPVPPPFEYFTLEKQAAQEYNRFVDGLTTAAFVAEQAQPAEPPAVPKDDEEPPVEDHDDDDDSSSYEDSAEGDIADVNVRDDDVHDDDAVIGRDAREPERDRGAQSPVLPQAWRPNHWPTSPVGGAGGPDPYVEGAATPRRVERDRTPSVSLLPAEEPDDMLQPASNGPFQVLPPSSREAVGAVVGESDDDVPLAELLGIDPRNAGAASPSLFDMSGVSDDEDVMEFPQGSSHGHSDDDEPLIRWAGP